MCVYLSFSFLPVNISCSVGGGSLTGKLLGEKRSPFLALDVDYMDINTMHGMTIGWEKGEVAGSQYLPWYLPTQHTGERAKGCTVKP